MSNNNISFNSGISGYYQNNTSVPLSTHDQGDVASSASLPSPISLTCETGEPGSLAGRVQQHDFTDLIKLAKDVIPHTQKELELENAKQTVLKRFIQTAKIIGIMTGILLTGGATFALTPLAGMFGAAALSSILGLSGGYGVFQALAKCFEALGKSKEVLKLEDGRQRLQEVVKLMENQGELEQNLKARYNTETEEKGIEALINEINQLAKLYQFDGIIDECKVLLVDLKKNILKETNETESALLDELVNYMLPRFVLEGMLSNLNDRQKMISLLSVDPDNTGFIQTAKGYKNNLTNTVKEISLVYNDLIIARAQCMNLMSDIDQNNIQDQAVVSTIQKWIGYFENPVLAIEGIKAIMQEDQTIAAATAQFISEMSQELGHIALKKPVHLENQAWFNSW